MDDDQISTLTRPAQVYLLRVWPSSAVRGWHAALEELGDGSRQHFRRPEELLAFLTAARPSPEGAPYHSPPLNVRQAGDH